MVELATWNHTHQELTDHNNAPWDNPNRRPSHADRRNFLRRSILLNEFNIALNANSITKKLKKSLKRLLQLPA